MFLDKNKQYQRGELQMIYIAIFTSIFTGVFLAVSIAIENFAFIGVGAAVGVPIGITLGKAQEDKLEKEGLLLEYGSEDQPNIKRIAGFLIGGILLAGFILFLFVYLKNQ